MDEIQCPGGKGMAPQEYITKTADLDQGLEKSSPRK